MSSKSTSTSLLVVGYNVLYLDNLYVKCQKPCIF